jgi:hypothetical protein
MRTTLEEQRRDAAQRANDESPGMTHDGAYAREALKLPIGNRD